jgi:hypothetical protein
MAVTSESIKKVKEQGSCWKNYEQVGMKPTKKGNMVPNCVPKKKKKESSADGLFEEAGE